MRLMSPSPQTDLFMSFICVLYLFVLPPPRAAEPAGPCRRSEGDSSGAPSWVASDNLRYMSCCVFPPLMYSRRLIVL